MGPCWYSGLARGGVDGARQTLHDFWRDVSAASALSIGQSPLDGLSRQL